MRLLSLVHHSHWVPYYPLPTEITRTEEFIWHLSENSFQTRYIRRAGWPRPFPYILKWSRFLTGLVQLCQQDQPSPTKVRNARTLEFATWGRDICYNTETGCLSPTMGPECRLGPLKVLPAEPELTPKKARGKFAQV